MIVHGLLLAAIGLGHFCLTVLLVNWSHGLGLPERTIHRLTAVFFVLLVVFTCGAAWVVVQRDWHAWPWALQAYAAACVAVACLGLPVVTLVRANRRLPSGISGGRRERDLVRECDSKTFEGPSRRSWMLRLPGNESLQVEWNDWTIDRPGLPKALDGLTILQLADLHFASTYSPRFFESIVEQAASWSPDIVLFTGDLVDDVAAIPWIEPILSRIHGRLGSYAILGNHDYHYDTAPIESEIERSGFSLIEGRWTHIDVRGSRIAIGGTSAPWGPPLDLKERPDADACLLLCHTPDGFPSLSGWGVDLMFSGHNHGGQVVLPIVGPVLMPSRFSRRFDHGFFQSGRTLLYVSRGLAAKHPIRYGCPPEITRFTLRVPQTTHTPHRQHRSNEVAGTR